jgi:murein DD-endopeptidase MepM/ murein hydrolase activator NlpD
MAAMTVPTDTMAAAIAVDGPAPAAAPVSAAARAKVKQLAQEFESLLMSQMLKEMRKSMLSEDEDQEPGFGAANMTEMMDTALGAALSRAGGFGLADVMLRGLDRQFPVAAAQGAVGAPAVAPVAQDLSFALRVSPTERPVATSLPSAAAVPVSATAPSPGAAASVTAPDGRVSSAYGWRADPLNGQARFHKGTDIALAYGHEVQAAASGRVAFAGEQPGYGMTVVIDHGAGLETRYAHLSGYSVRVGDAVGSGQVVARSGNSGRSTGPHLHFEVLQGGRPVDPKSLAARS